MTARGVGAGVGAGAPGLGASGATRTMSRTLTGGSRGSPAREKAPRAPGSMSAVWRRAINTNMEAGRVCMKKYS